MTLRVRRLFKLSISHINSNSTSNLAVERGETPLTAAIDNHYDRYFATLFNTLHF